MFDPKLFQKRLIQDHCRIWGLISSSYIFFFERSDGRPEALSINPISFCRYEKHHLAACHCKETTLGKRLLYVSTLLDIPVCINVWIIKENLSFSNMSRILVVA
jgi:hypothetical protein